MSKYQKKPVVIDAFKLGAEKYPQWFFDLGLDVGIVHELVDGRVEIETLEGNHMANVGDFIIKGVHDELYPCKPDIFAETHEAVVDDD